jgi:rubrerythrin
MNRDFEFKQLLRAYRAGIINEKTFEAEMAEIEHGANANGGNGTAGGFRYLGKTYKSERDAVVSFLDKSRAGEANGAEIFRNWAKVCTTDCIRSGLKMIAEREDYHARIFENRLRELGAECRAEVSAEGLKIKECASDPKMSDNAKLLDFNKILTNPDELIRPIFEFAELIKEDLETKEALRLFAEDELSSTKWLKYACAALNAPAAVASTTTNMVAMSEEM